MPQVPSTLLPDTSPQDIPSPLLRVQAVPDAFGVNIGQAVQHLGTTLGHVGDELFERAKAMQQLRNETARTNAVAEYEMRAGEEHEKYRSLQGVHAVDAADGYRAKINSLRQEIRDGLPNDMARKMYDSQALGIQNRLIQSGSSWAATQNRHAANNASQARIDSAVSASRYSMDDDQFEENLKVIEQQARDQADLGGLDKDSADQHVWKWQSAARAKRIQDATRSDPIAAKRMFDEAMDKGQLHGNDVDKTWNLVQSHLDHVGSRVIADNVFKPVADPEGFLRGRGAPRAEGIDPNFGKRLTALTQAAESATGQKAKIESLVRTTAEQAEIRARHEAMPGGVELHPAAKPGESRHEFGMAADIGSGPVADWMRKHAAEFGLEMGTIKNDPNHIQLASKDTVPDRTSIKDIPVRHLEDVAGAEARKIAPNNPEFEQYTRAKVRAQYYQRAQDERITYEQNYNTAIDPIVNNGAQTIDEVLADPAASAAYFQLDNRARKQIQRMVSEKKVQTNNEEYRRLRGLASGSPEEQQEFLSENIVDNKQLSAGHQRDFIRLQERVRKSGEVDPKITHAVETLRFSGVLSEEQFKDKEFMPQFRGALWDAITTYEAVEGAYPKREQVMEMGKGLLKEVGATKPPYELPRLGVYDIRNLPWWIMGGGRTTPAFQKAREEIKEQWSAAHNGVEPTEEQIRQVFQADLYQELHGKKK